MHSLLADSLYSQIEKRVGDDVANPEILWDTGVDLLGLAMDGGIHHAIDCLTPKELCAAIDGFSYFGFEGMAHWLKNASTDPLLKQWTDDTETLANSRRVHPG